MSEAAIIIIGAGHAAVRAALSARQAGHAGAVTMIASEGVDQPYERPPLSKWSGQEVLVSQPIIPAAQLREAGITQIPGMVTSINRDAKSVTLSDGRSLAYDRLLLTTGASARRLSPKIACGAEIHYLRDFADAQALRTAARSARSAIIIGGGFIGLELAASLRSGDIQVQVLEMAPRPLSRAITPEVAQIVHDLHVRNGVQFHFGAEIAQIIGPNTVNLQNGTELTADLVIAGIGSTPNTDLAKSAGLHIDNGIVVDRFLRTNDLHIFAAGDCCSFPLYAHPGRMTRLESWQSAGDQGDIAGRNMVSEVPEPFQKVPWFWSNQYDHVLQVAGISSPDLDVIARPYTVDHHLSLGCTSDGALKYACGIAPGAKIAKDIRYSSKLIEAGTRVDKRKICDPDISLKTAVRAA